MRVVEESSGWPETSPATSPPANMTREAMRACRPRRRRTSPRCRERPLGCPTWPETSPATSPPTNVSRQAMRTRRPRRRRLARRHRARPGRLCQRSQGEAPSRQRHRGGPGRHRWRRPRAPGRPTSPSDIATPGSTTPGDAPTHVAGDVATRRRDVAHDVHPGPSRHRQATSHPLNPQRQATRATSHSDIAPAATGSRGDAHNIAKRHRSRRHPIARRRAQHRLATSLPETSDRKATTNNIA